MKRFMFILVFIFLIILIFPYILELYSSIQNYFGAIKDAEKLPNAISGYYTSIKHDSDRIQFYTTKAGKSFCDFFSEEEYEYMINNQNSYSAFEVEISLENHSGVDLFQLEVSSPYKDVYVDDGGFISDTLPAGAYDSSQYKVWLIIKTDDKTCPHVNPREETLSLEVRGVTIHNYKYNSLIQFKDMSE